MDDLRFDEMSLSRAVQNIIDTGTANALGEVLAQGIGEHLEMYLRTLSREAAQAAPSRDQLAAMAMQALIVPGDPTPSLTDRQLARAAYQIADAMLAARAEEGSRAA